MAKWDDLVDPARIALEALITSGDNMTDRVEELEAKLEQAKWMLVEASVQLREGKANTRRNRADLIDMLLAELKGEKDE